MDNGSSLTASDVALLSGNNAFDGFGGGGAFMWIFALLILAGGGFGGWGNNGFANAIGYENLATSNEVQRGFDNQNQLANEREILSAVNAGTAQAVAATNQTFHDTLGIIQNRYDELARDICIDKSGVARALSSLEEKGFVERKTDPENKRRTLVFPTEKLLEAIPSIRELAVKWNKLVSEGISEEEFAIFQSVLFRMEKNARKIIEETEMTAEK